MPNHGVDKVEHADRAGKAAGDRTQVQARLAAERPATPAAGSTFVDNRPGAIAQRKLLEVLQREYQQNAQAVRWTGSPGSPHMVDQQRKINSIFGQAAQLQTVQFDKAKEAREAEVRDILKAGAKHIGSIVGKLRPYLSDCEQNFQFLAGLIRGGFNFTSLGTFLDGINGSESHSKDKALQADIANAFLKVIAFKQDFTAIVGEGRDEFCSGRIAEFLGLAGELSAAAQLIQGGKTVSRLGAEHEYGNNSRQEVDLTVKDGDDNYFVEVAATPSKLKDKIDGGIKNTYPQMQGYKNLAGENAGSRVAYSCPILSPEQISDELIDKIGTAEVSLIVKGKFYDAGGLRELVKEHEKSAQKSKKKTSKSHKQTERSDRPERLRDRGTKPTAKSLLEDAVGDYYDNLSSDDYEDDYEDEYEDY